jgi:hypothetical protein
MKMVRMDVKLMKWMKFFIKRMNFFMYSTQSPTVYGDIIVVDRLL